MRGSKTINAQETVRARAREAVQTEARLPENDVVSQLSGDSDLRRDSAEFSLILRAYITFLSARISRGNALRLVRHVRNTNMTLPGRRRTNQSTRLIGLETAPAGR